MNKNIKIVIMLIAVLIIIALVLIISINILDSRKNDKTVGQTEETTNVISEEELDKARDEVVSTKNETSRIKTYLGQYFSYIEGKDYQKAYDVLFDNFKNNYFTSLEQFEQYIEYKYPKNIVLNYTKVDRQGNIFIITVEIINGLDITNKFEQRFVIQENELNNFNISFQVENSEE